MSERLSIQIKEEDNVVVAVHDLPAGTTLESGVVTREPIPQAHKIALRDIPAGGEILRYGVVLGYARYRVPGPHYRSNPVVEEWKDELQEDVPAQP